MSCVLLRVTCEYLPLPLLMLMWFGVTEPMTKESGDPMCMTGDACLGESVRADVFHGYPETDWYVDVEGSAPAVGGAGTVLTSLTSCVSVDCGDCCLTVSPHGNCCRDCTAVCDESDVSVVGWSDSCAAYASGELFVDRIGECGPAISDATCCYSLGDLCWSDPPARGLMLTT